MGRKLFYGWCSKTDDEKTVFFLDEFGEEYTTSIFKTKSTKNEWGEYHWPPRRVKIIVEVE